MKDSQKYAKVSDFQKSEKNNLNSHPEVSG